MFKLIRLWTWSNWYLFGRF